MLLSLSVRHRPLVGLLLLAVMAYGPVLGNGYVWDDIPLIVQNRLFQEAFALQSSLFADLWAGASIGDEAASGYFRPVMVASLWFDHGLGGGAPLAHLHSLVWHFVAVVAGFRLGQQVGGDRLARVGALFFALHPLQTEAVMWVAARNDLLAAAFSLIALNLFLADRARPIWTGLFVLLAACSKESVFLLPIAAVVVWFARPRAGGHRALAWRMLPVVLGLVAVVAMRGWVDVGATRGPTAPGVALLVRSLPELVGWLGWKLVWAWPMSTGYALEYLGRLPLVGLLAGGLALFGGGTLLLRRGGTGVRVGLAWAALFLIPAGWALATTGWMGERYLYLSLLGVGWAIGAGLDGLVPKWGRVGVLVAIIWAGQVALRSADWSSDHSLWVSAHRATPSPFTSESVGHAIRGELGPEEALPYFVGALDDPLPLSTACVPLMRSAVATHKMVRAAQLSHWATMRGCGGLEFRGWRAIVLASTGRWDRLEAVVEEDGTDPDGRLEIARAALALHWGDEVRVRELEAGWTGSQPLRSQAEALVNNSRRHAPVVAPQVDTDALP